MQGPRSHIECLGSERSRCGYCRTRYTSRNFGVWAHRLDVRDYQALLDAGWRRSGAYLYRPDLGTTCCPSFVIRLDAFRYVPSVSQKRVLKRLRRVAALPALSLASSSASGAATPKWNAGAERNGASMRSTSTPESDELRESVASAVFDSLNRLLDQPRGLVVFPSRDVVQNARPAIKVFPPRQRTKSKKKAPPANRDPPSQSEQQCSEHIAAQSKLPVLVSNVAMALAACERKSKATTQSQSPKAESSAIQVPQVDKRDNSGCRAVKSKQVQRQMELARVIAQLVQESSADFASVTATEPGFLNFWKKDEIGGAQDGDMMHESIADVKRIEAQDVNASCLKQTLRTSDEISSKKLGSSLNPPIVPLSRAGSDVSSERTAAVPDYPSPVPESTIRISVERERPPSVPRLPDLGEELSGSKSFTMEFLPSQFRAEAYEVFRKYQMAVHSEPPEQCGEETYRRFLVDSPLIQSRSSLDSEQSYGSFHVMYRIRGRLLAVGVVDVLPRCLSSVYLFYDPDFAKLSPGTLSAIHEIEWVKRASAFFPTMQFYYMGYYIHSCPKMRYKAAYYPSEILCEETKNWIPVKDAMAILESSRERQLRLAPPTMPPAVEAEKFLMDEDELTSRTNESKLQINFGQHGVRIVTLTTLESILPSDYQEQVEVLRRKIRRFVALVGKISSRFYLHNV